MDIILLPIRLTKIQKKPKLYRKKGIERFNELLSWGMNKQVNSQIYAYLLERSEDHRDLLLSFLRTTGTRFANETYLITELRRINKTFLKKCYINQINELIILAPQKKINSTEEKTIRLIQEFLQQKPSYNFKLRLWINPQMDTRDYSRLHFFQNSGIPFSKIETPCFSIGNYKSTEATNKTISFDEVLTDIPTCSLFKNTLTIDTDGQVYPCPQFAGMQADFEADNIFQMTPDQIIINKGIYSQTTGMTGICAACKYSCRLSWPEEKNSKISELFEKGKNQYNITKYNPPIFVNESSVEDLNQVGAEKKKKELEQFEKRLDEWKKNMVSWEDNKKNN